jgi:hypothetical protein
MNLTLRIPDALAARLGGPGADLERLALEALVVDGFRAGRLNKDELGRALGLDGGDAIDGLLKAHDVFEPCSVEDVNREVKTLSKLGF